MTAEDFGTLVTLLPEGTFQGSGEQDWGFPNYQTAMFAFSIISTVGYGNIAPTSDWGKVWLIIVAVVGVPATVGTLGVSAAHLMQFVEWMAVKAMDEVKIAFDHYDTDKSGNLSMQEFRLALEDLGISLTQDQFDHLVAETDDGSGEIDIDEFTHCTAKLKLPIGRVARMKLRLRVSLGLTTLWLVLGVLVFSSLEGWRALDALYFCIVTMTTVGLGDLVPASRGGIIFNFVFSIVGLGLVALDIAAISEAWAESTSERGDTSAVTAATKYDTSTQPQVQAQRAPVSRCR